MARELVTEKGIGEKADQVWASLQRKQEEVFGIRSSAVEDSGAGPTQGAELFTTEASNRPASQLIPLTAPLEAIRPKAARRGGVLEGQLTLF
jgi:hypothetical protein